MQPKILAALLIVPFMVTIAVAIGLFNLAASHVFYPDYRSHTAGKEFLLQIPFTLSRTYSITLVCGENMRRNVTVKEWNSDAAAQFALERMDGCTHVISVHRWRKRGRS